MLRGYLVRGDDVPTLAIDFHCPELFIRALLREEGVVVGLHEKREPISAAVHRLGYASFDEFERAHELTTLAFRARKLCVSSARFCRILLAYERLLEGETS